jgi:hypothetical protein
LDLVWGLRFLLLHEEQRQTLRTLNLLSSGDGDPSKLRPRALQQTRHVLQTVASINHRRPPPHDSRCPATIFSEFTVRPFKILSSSRKIECSPKKKRKQNFVFSTFGEHLVLRRRQCLICAMLSTTAFSSIEIQLFQVSTLSQSSRKPPPLSLSPPSLFLITCFYFCVFRIS